MKKALTICMIAVGALCAADDPWAIDKPLVSPAHSFTIFQKNEENWSTTLHWQHNHVPDIRFTDSYAWPALFYISPDDHWILQIQKSGSGDNISFLLQIDPKGRVWRMEPTLMALTWAFLECTRTVHESDLYHTGIEFSSWDLKAQRLHFTFHGTYDKRPADIEVPLIYDLKRNVITRDSKPYPPHRSGLLKSQ